MGFNSEFKGLKNQNLVEYQTHVECRLDGICFDKRPLVSGKSCTTDGLHYIRDEAH